MIVSVIVAVLNALGALLPQIPALINELKGHADLNDNGKAALDLVEGRIAKDEADLDKLPPLPVPDPTPTPKA